MLACCLDVADLAELWTQQETGWHSGSSYVRPYAHPRLESFGLRTHDQFLVAVRERIKGNPSTLGRAGTSFESAVSFPKVDESAFLEAVREIEQWPLDFILLRVSRHGVVPEVRISCGAWGSAPIYLVEENGTLWVDWDPARLYPRLPSASLDETRAVHYLVKCGCPYSRETLFPGMRTLTERASATWSPSHPLLIEYPQPASLPRPRPLKANADVIGTFREIIAASMQRWVDPDSPVAAEFSGGLDTSIVAAVAAQLSRSSVRTYGLIMPGELGQLQQERRRELISRFNLTDFCIDAMEHLPLSQDSARIRANCFVPWHEFYYEAFEKLLRQAAKDNVDLLFSGNGGDELFYLHAHEWTPEQRAAKQDDILPQRERLPVFITERAFECYRDTLLSLDRAPRGQMPRSALTSSANASTLYLSLGLWPVSPFATPELAWFCGSLPREWRENRKLQREFLASLGCSRKVTHPEKTETFVPVMESGLRNGARQVLEQMFRDSRLAQRGLVDRDLLLKAYADYCRDGGREGEDLEEAFMAVAVLELATRCLEAQKSVAAT